MVAYKLIQASNASLHNVDDRPFVAVFVGGTSGVGKATVQALVATGMISRIHIIGRKSAAEQTRALIEDSRAINAHAEVSWTEAEVSLLMETKRVCKDLRAQESHVDLLFMTTGYTPWESRVETSEGLEVTQSLEYYTRMLFIRLLGPLIDKASGRVVSVLAGGYEPATIHADDLELKEPGHFGGFGSQFHYAAMNTMAMDKMARSPSHQRTTFVHAHPGYVDSGNHHRGAAADSIMNRYLWPVADVLFRRFATSAEESGQRHLFLGTSAMFGGGGLATWDGAPGRNSFNEEGRGLFLVNYVSDCIPNVKNVSRLREETQEKIWAHTEGVLGPFL
jgi:NAD(P)-dependent dehydrogenase (short-subunit alcohol dehydrogenase family)